MAARSYGIYAGINTAISHASDKSTLSVHHADEIRAQMALMTVVRAFALLDRSTDLSIQKVYRFLEQPHALDVVSQLYSESDPHWPLDSSRNECRKFFERFLTEYRTIDWESFGRLQSFRNNALAHIGVEITKFVRYQELELIVRTCARLSGEFTLMVSGLNHWPEEDIDEYSRSAFEFWSSLFAADVT